MGAPDPRPDPAVGPEPGPANGPVPTALRALVVLVAVQTMVEAFAVAGRTELTAALRVTLVGVIALKWWFAWGAARLRAGPALGLLLLQGTTVVAALSATELGSPARLALGLTAVLASVLLLASLHAFPSPTLPPR